MGLACAGITHTVLSDPSCRAENVQPRTWVDDQGRKVEAALVGKTVDSVVLELGDGRKIPFPIVRLSRPDRDYIATWISPVDASTLAVGEDRKPQENELSNGDLPDPEDLPKPDDWPTSISAGTNIEVIEAEESTEGAWIFDTEHFRFHCNAKLGKNVLSEFARLFEAVYAALDQSPLPLLNSKVDDLRVVRLFETVDQYMAAGGLPGSAGVFLGQSKEVLVPLDSLGVKRVGSRFSIESRDENQTLIHEIVHQLTWHWPLGQWWIEGVAEFFAGADYSPGRLKFAGHGNSLREYLKERKGVWEEEYVARSPAKMFTITNAEWNAEVAGNGSDGVRNYASAAIIFYFFCRMDGEGDGAPMLAHLRAVKAGMDPAESINVYLLRGRSHDELAEEIARAWRRHKLDLTFD